jgi:hypothetical protein
MLPSHEVDMLIVTSSVKVDTLIVDEYNDQSLMFAAAQWYSFDAMNMGFHIVMNTPEPDTSTTESKKPDSSDEEEGSDDK